MAGASIVERALQRERLLVGGALALVVVISWAYLLSGAGMMMEMAGEVMPMSMGPWTAGHAAVIAVMWVAMMAAMMLPSAAPMVLFHAAMLRRRGDGGARAELASAAFVGGVMNLAWIAGIALFVAVEKLVPAGHVASRIAGALLVAWGIAVWLAGW